MKYPKIRTAKAIDDFTLVVEFTNQELKRYDIRQLFNVPMFSPLRQPEFFKNFEIAEGGYGLVWNEEVDISEYELWENGIALASEELIEEHC
jgi:hypothetical protein